MQDVIRQFEENFGQVPRSFSFWNRVTYLNPTKPLWLWMRPWDGLNTLFQQMNTLLSNGVVVWGQVVQANSLLYQVGLDNCPAEVVYSITDRNRIDVVYLRDLSRELFQLKNTNPQDPELRAIANHLTNETTRVFGLPVPDSLSPKFKCVVSTTFIVRSHLPGRRLCNTIIPMIVNIESPYVALPLPSRYWPSDFVRHWRG